MGPGWNILWDSFEKMSAGCWIDLKKGLSAPESEISSVAVGRFVVIVLSQL